MKKHLSALIAIVSLTVTTSCNPFSIENKLTSHPLKLVRIEKPIFEEQETDSIKNNAVSCLERLPLESSFLRLFAQGELTALQKNQFNFGHWNFSSKDSILSITQKTADLPQTMKLKLVAEQSSVFKFKLIEINKQKAPNNCYLVYAMSDHYETFNKDLLSIEENKWRIKPGKNESTEELKQRIIAQLQYHVDYFEMTADKNQSFFKTGLLQSPFNFYQHSLAVPDTAYLHSNWENLFYNQKDAVKAAKLLSSAIKNVENVKAQSTFTKTYNDIINKMIKQLAI